MVADVRGWNGGFLLLLITKMMRRRNTFGQPTVHKGAQTPNKDGAKGGNHCKGSKVLAAAILLLKIILAKNQHNPCFSGRMSSLPLLFLFVYQHNFCARS
jgi:hypothetical protein